ncbi:hypothetical protein Cgig2_016935 [Carnegiea gigantea]|uniref:Uncharacterized protein n=1 Tax=Carnegiea gigantea TaxID=171969 RepID=A0A9Q1GW84_9CARY|nr:hypothetical protein Cgig2_016935 [Carnegiea gigantea]
MAKADGLRVLLQGCKPPCLEGDFLSGTGGRPCVAVDRYPKDYQQLCPSFTLPIAEEAACNFDILEIIQATFYTKVINDVVELSVVSMDIAGALKSTLKVPSCAMVFPDFLSTEQAVDYVRATFRWHLSEVSRPFRPLPENYHDLCPYFDLDMAEESTQDFLIPEITQAVFYTMVVNNAVELAVTSRDMANAKAVMECF